MLNPVLTAALFKLSHGRRVVTLHPFVLLPNLRLVSIADEAFLNEFMMRVEKGLIVSAKVVEFVPDDHGLDLRICYFLV